MGCTESKSDVKEAPGRKNLSKAPQPKVVTAQPPKDGDQMTIADSHFPGGARVVPKISETTAGASLHVRRASKERTGSKASVNSQNGARVADSAGVVPAHPHGEASLEEDPMQLLR